MAGKVLGRSLHRVAEGGIEIDAADLPAMIAVGDEAPIRAPAELLLAAIRVNPALYSSAAMALFDSIPDG